ncbi:hypothetical protein DLAC_07016 [Tieghemostelium lacteum]|uniref:Intimal thickness related receptor IRP domain-containing protein n=1 Tax=Tieghemostelium lacteum TaxID=361077 RepID=A0A151ZDZ7_TIELA|nr:hypothetical protein DLAC_07016 [Tieghemostelium lacteum]|eukprot:KYQ92176.1 hypothetical protein DLAC_07016 [Tieghemostelium lacteum]
MTITKFLIVNLILFSLLFNISDAIIRNFEVYQSSNQIQFFYSFSFQKNGVLDLKVNDFYIKNNYAGIEKFTGFIVIISPSYSSPDLEELFSDIGCETYLAKYENPIYPMTTESEFSFFIDGIQNELGYYSVFFINCKQYEASYNITLDFTNHHGEKGEISHLPFGSENLVSVYNIFSIMFLGLFLLWTFTLYRANQSKININPIHFIMAFYLLMEFIRLFFDFKNLSSIELTGLATKWEYSYRTFVMILQGVSLNILIGYIGNGVYFIKKSMTESEKLFFYVFVPLQVIDQILYVSIVLSTTQSQSIIYFIIHFLSVLSCGVPVSLTSYKLNQDQKVSEKSRNLYQIYKIITNLLIVYIYFNVIGLVFLRNALPSAFTWVNDFASLSLQFIISFLVGYKLAPSNVFSNHFEKTYFNL